MEATQNQLPDLRKINQRIALNGVRIHAFLEGLSPRLDNLLEAAGEGNMAEVGRLSHFIQRCSDIYGYEELAAKAGEVCDSAAGCESKEMLGRKVIRLVGEFARTSRNAPSIHA